MKLYTNAIALLLFAHVTLAATAQHPLPTNIVIENIDEARRQAATASEPSLLSIASDDTRTAKAPQLRFIVRTKNDAQARQICKEAAGKIDCICGRVLTSVFHGLTLECEEKQLVSLVAEHRAEVTTVAASLAVSASSSASLRASRLSISEVLKARSAQGAFKSMESTAVSSTLTGKVSDSWGVDRVYPNRGTLRNSAGLGAKVFVLDSGIRCTHYEFKSKTGPRCEHGFSATGTGFVDRHGHGTHCAGTVAGNKYGVAMGATVVNVKVLKYNESTKRASGSDSWIVEGIDWVVEQKKASPSTPMVISMSLGRNGTSSIYNDAVAAAHDFGIPVVAAAGNDNIDACGFTPANAPKAFTIGATTVGNDRADFSNYGSCVDLFAPGDPITSAGHWSDSAAKQMWGTSMATPHVAGALAVLMVRKPLYKCDLRYNFVEGSSYSQISLTDHCSNAGCDQNPKYSDKPDKETAVKYCENECSSREGCKGFFFQRHTNGHEICGFFTTLGRRVRHGHQEGSRVCLRSYPSADAVESALLSAAAFGKLKGVNQHGTPNALLRVGFGFPATGEKFWLKSADTGLYVHPQWGVAGRGTKLHFWPGRYSHNEFTVEPASNGGVLLKSAVTGLYVYPAHGYAMQGAKLFFWSGKGYGDNGKQIALQWETTKRGNVFLKSTATGMYVHPDRGVANQHKNLVFWGGADHGSSRMAFEIERVPNY